jgi:hypothetical protein
MRSRHCAAECRLKASGGMFDRWSSCIRSMSDLGQNRRFDRVPMTGLPR